MASRGRRPPSRGSRRPSVRERREALVAEEDAALEGMTAALFERVLGPAWARLGPLSAGAVAGSVAIVGTRGLLRRLLGRRYGRVLSWVGAAALVPLALWLLSGDQAAEDTEPQAGDEATAVPETGTQPETTEA